MLKMYRLLKLQTVRVAPTRKFHGLPEESRRKIGAREVVGRGKGGNLMYNDSFDFPMPAVRFRPDTPEIKELRQKERGDWKALTLAEKKTLYRASFRQTFQEMERYAEGDNKAAFGTGLVLVGLGLWLNLLFKESLMPELPETLGEELQRHQTRKLIDMRFNPFEGISSRWDYEKNEWKK